MNVKQILENCPLSKEIIKQHLLKKMKESADKVNDITAEFKEFYLNILDDEKIEQYISEGSLDFLELLDSYKIYLNIIRHVSESFFVQKSTDVNTEDFRVCIKNAMFITNNRKQSYLNSLKYTFELLEIQLKEKNNG